MRESFAKNLDRACEVFGPIMRSGEVNTGISKANIYRICVIEPNLKTTSQSGGKVLYQLNVAWRLLLSMS